MDRIYRSLEIPAVNIEVVGKQIAGSENAPTLIGYVKSLSNTDIHHERKRCRNFSENDIAVFVI